jgi:hypothetical protein
MRRSGYCELSWPVDAKRDQAHYLKKCLLSLNTVFMDIIFFIHTVQRRCSQHTRTLTPMNTRTQTLPQ